MISATTALVFISLIIIIFAALQAYRENLWRIERKDLYDRIMAGGLAEYRSDAKEKPSPRGGNMVTVGLRKAHNQQMKQLRGDD
mgnify:CR=1 FL=1